jgi:8-amino-7-oxononanoate synthase
MNWDLDAELADLASRHLLRRLTVRHASAGLLNFASNDYLGLAQSEFLKQALREGVERCGAGTGASRLVTGTTAVHRELEESIAAFKQKPAALTFSSGYAAALGTITALVGPGDTLLLDKLSHASLIDAARLSGATLRVFPHNHMGKLQALLESTAAQSRRVLIVTESVFSMDGDTAPLQQIIDLKERSGAWLLLDEAHALGIMGPGGRGLAAELGLSGQVELHLGTLSKAVGLSGGYLAASRAVVDVLINRARSFIYTTAPPAAIAHAAMRALDYLVGPEGDVRRQQLMDNVRQLKTGLGSAIPSHLSAIHPHIVGEEAEALRLAESSKAAGIVTPAIRYPTVPRGSARLRITLTADHRAEEISRLLTVMKQNQRPPEPM